MGEIQGSQPIDRSSGTEFSPKIKEHKGEESIDDKIKSLAKANLPKGEMASNSPPPAREFSEQESNTAILEQSRDAGIISTHEPPPSSKSEAPIKKAPERYTVKTDTPQMKKLDQYAKTKQKLTAKAKRKAWSKIPHYQEKVDELNESIFGSATELKGESPSVLEKDYIEARKSELEEKKRKLSYQILPETQTSRGKQIEVLLGKMQKLQSEMKGLKIDHPEDLNRIEDIRNEVKAINAELDKVQKPIDEIQSQISELFQKKSLRTTEVVQQLKDPINGQGGTDFNLSIPDLHGSGKEGTVQGMFFGAKGKDFDPSKKTVLIMTGSGDRAENYASPMVEALQDEGYQSVIFNYMGFGESRGEMSEWGLYASAESVYQYLTEAKGVPEGNVTLLGYSLGGYVVAEIALNHPNVSGVVMDRSYTGGLDVADKEMGRLGKVARQFMKDHVGELNTEKKMKKMNPDIKVAIFDDEEELKEKSSNFGEKKASGEWGIKKSFQNMNQCEHHVIEGKGHYHPSTGVWFSEDKPQTAKGARTQLFAFLAK